MTTTIGSPPSQPGEWTLLASNSFSAQSSVDFTGLPDYKEYKVVIGVTCTALTRVRMRLNNVSAAGSYAGCKGLANLTLTTDDTDQLAASIFSTVDTSQWPHYAEVYITNHATLVTFYANASTFDTGYALFHGRCSGIGTGINQITIFAVTGTMTGGIKIYGRSDVGI